jgi:ascorbate-specific PTS system EIIC-type component UlaA
VEIHGQPQSRYGTGYLLLTVGTSQIITRMIPMTSKIQRIGPVKKPIEKPSNHKIKRIMPMTKSNANTVTSFCLLVFAAVFFPLFI